MFRNASQLQFVFIRIFFSPGPKGWYKFFFLRQVLWIWISHTQNIQKQCTGLDMIICVLSLYHAENANSIKFSCKDFGSSLLAENITPSNFSSLLSPFGGASMNSGCASDFSFPGYFINKKGRKSLQQITVILLVDKRNVHSHLNLQSKSHTLFVISS